MDSRVETDVLDGFDFVDNDRRFTCRVEKAGSTRDAWWWFAVSAAKADRHRYAPFRAEAGDTRASVQTAIVKFYDDLLARRAQPVASYWRRNFTKPAPAAT